MKRILAVLMALMLLVSGLALAEEAELAPELEDVAVEAEVEAEADEAPAAEEEDVLLGEGDGVAEANDAVYYMPYTVKNKSKITLLKGEKVQLVVDGQTIKSCKMKDAKSKKIAAVTKKGVLTAKKAGKNAKVIITTKKNKKLTVTVNVVAEPAPYTGELMELLGMTIDDAVAKVGGNKALIRRTGTGASYMTTGIVMGVGGDLEPAQSKYRDKVGIVMTADALTSLCGIHPGDTLESAVAQASAQGFAQMDDQAGNGYLAMIRSYEENGNNYEESLVIFSADGVVTEIDLYAGMVLERLHIDDLSIFIGQTLNDVAAQIGMSDRDVEWGEGQADLMYNDEFMLTSFYRSAGSSTSGVITSVVSYSENYPIEGMCVGDTAAEVRAKAEKLGYSVMDDEYWDKEEIIDGVLCRPTYNADYENGKVCLLSYSIYPAESGDPTEPTAVELPDKELTNYIGMDLNAVIQQAGGDVNDIHTWNDGDYEGYSGGSNDYELVRNHILAATDPNYGKISEVSANGGGYTIFGLSPDSTKQSLIQAAATLGFEVDDEEDNFVNARKMTTRDGNDFDEVFQLYMQGDDVTGIRYYITMYEVVG